MSKDRYERRHRRTTKHPESIKIMAQANFDAVPSLAEALTERTPSMSAHTPGPWKVDPELRVVLARSGAKLKDGSTYEPIPIARTGRGFNRPDTEAEANARLMAAAPELFEELERLVLRIENGERITLDPNVITAARAALAKARSGNGA